MSVLLIGSEGAQGKRYQAILKYLGVRIIRSDMTIEEPIVEPLKGVIIATPTELHGAHIRRALCYQAPILCEKPISKNLLELKSVFSEVREDKIPFSMVYQYRQLLSPVENKEPSYYNYFRHGNDGLKWDCLQIIGNARGSVHLAETSPVWDCTLRGIKLNIADMDGAYVREIRDWLEGVKHESLSELLEIHEKVNEFKL